jgi:hypothetical protein
MRACNIFLLALLAGVGIAAAAESGEQRGKVVDEAGLVRVYPVDRRVADFPEAEDLSTPEAAYAAINRVMASDDEGSWRRISARVLHRQLPPASAQKREVKPETAAKWLNARVVEVRIFKDRYGVVIAELPGDRATYDVRYVKLEGKRWLNDGQDWPGADVDAARETFARRCAELIEKFGPAELRRGRREKVEDPEEYLGRFVEFLKGEGKEPKEFVMEALGRHRVVIMGEVHHRPRYWGFNSSLVEDPKFPDVAGTIYMELPANDQGLIDGFLAAKELDTKPVIEMLRDMLWMGWPDKPMLDFFVTVWKVNRQLPADKKLRIMLVDMERPWNKIHKREDWGQYDVDRDKYMAENILRDIREQPEEKRNGLFIVGVGHTMLNLRHPAYPAELAGAMRAAGWHLREEMGEEVYALFPHKPVGDNMGGVKGYICGGLFDSAFEALERRSVAFPLTSGPFGEQPFDAFSDRPALGSYRDGYSAYLYLGPLGDEVFSPLIDGFYTDEFVKELDRRYQLMFGKGLVEGCHLAGLDAGSFIKWMSTSWGQPRESWKRLGSMKAWQYGR